MVFDSQFILGVNNIPRAELGRQCFDCMVFVPYVFLLKFLDVLRVDDRDDGFDCQRVDHLLEGVLLPIDIIVLLELEEIAPLGSVLDSWVEELGLCVD